MDDRAQIDTIDSTLLTPLVRRAYGNESLRLGQWTVQQIQGGAGEGIGTYRLTGEALSNDAPHPWSLILKVLGRSDSTMGLSSWSYWRREADVYQSGLMKSLPAGLKAPHCFDITEPADGVVWLWLEDIAEDQSVSWGVGDYARVAALFGQFNGYYLNEAPLPADPWLSQHFLQSWVAENAAAVSQLSQSLDFHWVQRVWPRAVAESLLQTWAERDLYLQTLERLPQTFCHHDVFRRNLIACSRPDGSQETAVLDWSFAGHGALGEELVPLTVASVGFLEINIFAGRELEEQVLAGYLQGLQDSGWRGDPQLVRLGYACAGALRYGVGVLRLFMPTLLDEALHPMAEQFWGRSFYELCEIWGIPASRFTLRLADEARDLKEKLGY